MKNMIYLFFVIIFVIKNFTEIDGAPVDDSPVDKAVVFFRKYGYPTGIQTRGSVTESSLKDTIETYQRLAGLNVTGVLDEATLDLMSQPRCQVSDISSNGNRYSAIGRWNINKLTYSLLNQPTKTQNIAKPIESIIETSFRDWAAVSSLNFTRSNSNPNVKIGFYSGYHGDDDAFDGPSGVLAHAFYPQDGRLHFDNDETWSDGTNSGINLRQVATHEIGHILGLGHSSLRSAVMYPTYNSYIPNFSLGTDDINGIVRLYGPNTGNNPETSTSTVTPSTTLSTLSNPNNGNNNPETSTSTVSPRTTTTTQAPIITPPINRCPEFECPGFCIPFAWVCDGDNDCRDFSDEKNCKNDSTTTRPTTTINTSTRRYRRTRYFEIFTPRQPF